MRTTGSIFMAIIFVALALVACAPARYATGDDATVHTGEDDADHDHVPDPRLQDPAVIAASSRIRVLTGGIDCPAEVVGLVDVHEPVKSTAEGLELLRRRAYLAGADAVVSVEFEHGEGGSEKTHLSGTAVRCKDLLRGRKYVVLGRIEVVGEMEHEDEALQQFKAKALEQGSNLVLNVRFEHGEGDRTKVTGTAVRAY